VKEKKRLQEEACLETLRKIGEMGPEMRRIPAAGSGLIQGIFNPQFEWSYTTSANFGSPRGSVKR
jgi:hypothetical protein